MDKRAGIFAAAALAAIALSACGVRGPLEPPPSAEAKGTATSGAAGDAGDNSASKGERHRPFILDGLL